MELTIGKIVNTHGIRGELKILPNSDFIEERFEKGNELFVKYGNKKVSLIVESWRMHKGCILVVFEGYHNINDVEKYKGLELLCEVDGSEDEDYYYFELIDCQVYYDDQLLGTVYEILESEAHDILRVQRENKKDVLIPYVDRFILNVDIDDKRIDVDLIEGML